MFVATAAKAKATTFTVEFNPAIRTSRWYNGSLSVRTRHAAYTSLRKRVPERMPQARGASMAITI